MNPKVSILVPVYNVSNFIERCVRSLFEQTFSDIEFIFVNDFTPDDSIDILIDVAKQYPQRKKHITIIHHQINKGIAASRNTAIQAATGDYIVYVDSDDYIALNMIEQLYIKAINENADIVVSDIYIKTMNDIILTKDHVYNCLEERLKEIIICEKSQPALWNKMIRRSLFKHINYCFPEGLNFYEDRLLMIKLYFYAKKIVKINEAYYFYVQYNTNAITKTRDRMHFENICQYWSYLEFFAQEINQYNNLKEIIDIQKVRSKAKLLIGTHSSDLRKEYSNIFHIEESKYISHFHRGEKLMLILVRYKLFGVAQLFHRFLLLKNKNRTENGKCKF